MNNHIFIANNTDLFFDEFPAVEEAETVSQSLLPNAEVFPDINVGSDFFSSNFLTFSIAIFSAIILIVILLSFKKLNRNKSDIEYDRMQNRDNKQLTDNIDNLTVSDNLDDCIRLFLERTR